MSEKMQRAIFGLMRGDEGKGKIVDYFSNEADIVVRYAGGPNAGHTIYVNDKKVVLHQIPSGILSKKVCVIGRGCVIDLKKLYKEILEVQEAFDSGLIPNCSSNDKVSDYLKISFGAHLIFNSHIIEDTQRENSGNGNGSTKCGIAPAYSDKYYRSGLRVYDLYEMLFNNDKLANSKFNIDTELLEICSTLNESNCFIDDEKYLNEKAKNFSLLFEGAQGVLLDIDSPYYPNVSSSSPGVGGILTGTGLNYQNLVKSFECVGVAKIYMSSVGVGKFLTEIVGDTKYNSGTQLREAGHEYGATTGRPRKVGWFDLPLLKYSLRTSGVNTLCLTRFDTLRKAFENSKFKVCVAYKNIYTNELIYEADIWNLDNYEAVYESFPIWKFESFEDENFTKFINFIKNHIKDYQVNLKYLSVGKERKDLIILN